MRNLFSRSRALSNILSRSVHARSCRTSNSAKPVAIHGHPENRVPPLARLPTNTLVRSLALTLLMSKSWIMRPSLAVMSFLCESKSVFFNPDKNLLLNKIMRWTLYNHFSAGSNAQEITQSLRELKGIGYQGVILGYAKEVVLRDNQVDRQAVCENRYSEAYYQAINEWKEGTLKTLDMLGRGDFLAVKLTGAGPIATDAMKALEPMPESISQAMNEICKKTKEQGSRILIDAEQQALQVGLDEWAIELMREHNKDGRDIIYNTIQGYLKASEANANRHVKLAAKEGWTAAIKLVRGAYIENDVRSLIHDTKTDTDRSYDAIADMLISQKLPEESNLTFPPAALFLATHNASSANKAIGTFRKRAALGLPNIKLECGQIMGMADELSCALLERYEEYRNNPHSTGGPHPGVYKALHWGTVAECMGYLYRRAVENRGATERTESMVAALKSEVWRRILP